MSRNKLTAICLLSTLLFAQLFPVLKAEDSKPLAGEISALKSEILRLQQDLSALENELLFPADSRINVFFSLEALDGFELESVELLQGDQVIAAHLYTKDEMRALRNGGIQPLFQGNLPPGEHQLAARLLGRNSKGGTFRQLRPVIVEKNSRTLYVELHLSGVTSTDNPMLQVKTWD